MNSFVRLIVPIVCALAIAPELAAAQSIEPAVRRDDRGRLQYAADERGNRIIDFSHCGYAGGDRAIPDVPGVIVVAPGDGDDGAWIQAALDRAATLPLNADGFRGAVVLARGRFEIAGELLIRASGIVLRGAGAQGAEQGGTTIFAAGLDRRPLIRIEGGGERKLFGAATRVADEYVPVGAMRLRVDDAGSFKAGNRILITRPSIKEWIDALGADAFSVGWRPGSRDVRWERTVVAVEGDLLTIDAPITTALEQRYGGGSVQKCEWIERIANVGVEDLQLISEFDEENPADEEHAWFGVVANNCRDVWIRRAEFRHFAGGAVTLLEGGGRATVEDCIAVEPVSEVGGYRRHTFFTQGGQTLFLRCWSEGGRHDFSVGHAAPGPNAFVNCVAHRALADSGPIESWASGVLYDNVRIDGGELRLDNRWSSPPGAGWAAANCVLWQCQAAVIRCFQPPTANNWALGTWAQYAGDGVFEARSDYVEPLSLYQAQLRDRLGEAADERVGPFLLDPVGSTNPTLEQAAAFTAGSRAAAPQLVELIRERMQRFAAGDNSTSHELLEAVNVKVASSSGVSSTPNAQSLRIINGKLAIGDQLLTGRRLTPVWWRGTIRPDEAPAFGPSITRFAPGRIGPGLTDDLPAVAASMKASGAAAYDHHYGLWYDRRRDDHLMVRRADGDVAPPFYEQPFARTARGRAWDGLSRYDLTKYNPWYWRRLHDFAQLCDQHGLALIHQNYFQHNILEAGAHWADCPWRPANNINDVEFPEPPPYVGDKRIFLGEQFYDIANPRRRELHRQYIRQCLNNFADATNVIQSTSAEYSGPLMFVQFWIDVIAEWQQETGRDVIVALSAPKDVQDAILQDPQRAKHVDVIDMRYWCYAAGGKLYAPPGGVHLAPRQHLRQTKLKPGGAAEIVRAVKEYRQLFPDKAVTYFAEQYCPSRQDGWAVLAGGGSLASVPKLPDNLRKSLLAMQPVEDVTSDDGAFCLGDGQTSLLLYAEHAGDTIELNLPDGGDWKTTWIDSESGETRAGQSLHGGSARLELLEQVLWLHR